jgi:hypothetical protein
LSVGTDEVDTIADGRSYFRSTIDHDRKSVADD